MWTFSTSAPLNEQATTPLLTLSAQALNPQPEIWEIEEMYTDIEPSPVTLPQFRNHTSKTAKGFLNKAKQKES